MDENLRGVGEFGLIERLKHLMPGGAGVRLGIGDDAAVVAAPAEALVTVDMLVEGVHFDFALSAPGDVGYKGLAVSVSDIAAMGGTPSYAFVAYGAPAETTAGAAEALAGGVADAAREFDVAVGGGDTVSAPCAIVCVTLIGAAPASGAIPRSGACAGDLLCLTGATGAAAAGLALLRRASDDGAAAVLERFPELARAHRRPRARVREGTIAASWGAHAMIDVSDGVGADAGHIAVESGVGLRLASANVPVARAVAEAADTLGVPAERLAVAGGEDYELLVAVHPHDVDMLRDAMSPTPLSVVGEFTSAAVREVEWSDGSRQPLEELGWDHFA